MILYYTVTTFHILSAILHKLKYHKDDDAILILFSPNAKRIQKKYLDSLHIFHTITFIEPILSPPLNRIVIDKIISQVEKLHINFSEFSTIYLYNDFFALGVYLNIKGISYDLFEEATGVLSRKASYMSTLTEIQRDLIQKFNLLGDSKYILNLWCDLNHQESGYKNAKVKHFSVVEELARLDKSSILKLVQVFCADVHPIENAVADTLLITQHFFNLGLLEYSAQISIYQLIVDYFYTGRLFIKPHPNDVQFNYKKIFYDAYVINRSLLSEFLPYFCANKFNNIISINSTGIYLISHLSQNQITFTVELLKNYQTIHKLYVALALIAHLHISSEIPIYLLGVNYPLFINLNKFYYKFTNQIILVHDYHQISYSASKKFVIVGDIPFNEEMFKCFDKIFSGNKKEDMLLFLNTQTVSCFVINYSLKYFYNFLPIKIELCSDIIQSDFIYFYSLIQEYMNKVGSFMVTKKLKYSGIQVQVDMSKEFEVKVLEGINRALEQRLSTITLSYKQLVRDYKNKCHEFDSAHDQAMNAIHQYQQTLRRANGPLFEHIVVRILTLFSPKKYKKYLRDRNAFFRDSKSSVSKFFYK